MEGGERRMRGHARIIRRRGHRRMNAMAVEIEPDLGAAVHRPMLPARRLNDCDENPSAQDQPPWNNAR
jgi:hypothetical protein